MPTTDVTLNCSIDDCIITDELDRRPSRPPDYEAENRALTALTETLARSPGDVLQRLTDLMLELGLGDSAGISLAEGEGAARIFRWVALSGEWGHFKGGAMPFSASPCGVVVSRDEVMLFQHPERVFPDANVTPLIEEILLVPFAVNGDVIGTVWANAHSEHRKLDREDARLLKNLSRFASAAHRMERALATAQTGEERQVFLLKLSDAMRSAADADSIIAAATRMLGERLGATRIVFAEIDEEAGLARLREGWLADGAEQGPSTLRLEDFGGPLLDGLRTGRTVRHDDVRKGAHEEPDLAALAKIGIEALVSVPLMVGGRLTMNITVHQDRPRAWTDSEIALIEDVAERLWATVERARVEDALRESEGKYRTLFETMGQGYGEVELLRDEHGRATDARYLLLNPAFEKFFGIPVADAVGRTAREVFVGIEDYWFAAYDRVSRSGHSDRIELELGPSGGCYALEIHPQGGDRLLIFYDDITERKRAEALLRESDERQAFLLAVGDATRAVVAPEAKIELAARMLGERLNASRILWAEYDWDRNVAHIFNGWFADGAKPFPAVMQLEDYEGEVLNQLKSGITVRVDDVGLLTGEPAYAAIAKLGVQALLSPPLLVEGRLKMNLSIHQHEPRRWTNDEVAVVEEVSERLWAEVVRARAEEALRESEHHAKLLLAELQHRVRNTLAIVRSIARRTAENSTSAEDMLAHFQGRLDAFSRVQAALTRSAGATVDLASLIDDELLAHAARDGEQVDIGGPDVALEPKVAERLSLAIHELTTNSVKHGALSTDGGRITVQWRTEGGDGVERLVLSWKESGVELDGAPHREGFGTELLLRSWPYDVQGETRMAFPPHGLEFELSMPLLRMDATN